MTDNALVALTFCVVATLLHVVSSGLALWRMQRRARPTVSHKPAVTIIRPICGLDYWDELTLRSTFHVDYPALDIIFCSERDEDPAAVLIRRLIAEHPAASARLLIGDERPTANPKLNNLVKGWAAARTEWIAMADSNVQLPCGYVDDMLSNFDGETGLVCSPPIGSRPAGFWAELECAFLNTYQARWQYAATAIGFGFAQGKSMLWRRDILDEAGGIVALGAEIAEDAAATKLVRAYNLRVRLVDRPFQQPLGPRKLPQIWKRQVRWARLRRATFPLFYLPEILTGSVFPVMAGTLAAPAFDLDPFAVFAALLVIWFGTETIVAKAAGWHIGLLSPPAWMLRDALLPVLWVSAIAGNSFTWRGNEMSVGGGLGIREVAS